MVDGGSEDETRDLAETTASLVINSSRGRGPQQNAGAAAAQGDMLLFLHADTWLATAGREQLGRALLDGNTKFGAFYQRIEATGLHYRMLELGNAFRARALRTPYGDQGLFFRRDFFESLGGFPKIPLMEDLRLMQTLRRSGHRPTILPGPLHVSARRWMRNGVVRQTLSNWSLVLSDLRGESPDVLSERYNTDLSSDASRNSGTRRNDGAVRQQVAGETKPVT